MTTPPEPRTQGQGSSDNAADAWSDLQWILRIGLARGRSLLSAGEAALVDRILELDPPTGLLFARLSASLFVRLRLFLQLECAEEHPQRKRNRHNGAVTLLRCRLLTEFVGMRTVC